MAPAGFPVFAIFGKAVGELAAVIGKQFDDLDGAGSARLCQEIDTTAFSLVSIDVDEYPARGTVDGDEQIAPCGLVRPKPRTLVPDSTLCNASPKNCEAL